MRTNLVSVALNKRLITLAFQNLYWFDFRFRNQLTGCFRTFEWTFWFHFHSVLLIFCWNLGCVFRVPCLRLPIHCCFSELFSAITISTVRSSRIVFILFTSSIFSAKSACRSSSFEVFSRRTVIRSLVRWSSFFTQVFKLGLFFFKILVFDNWRLYQSTTEFTGIKKIKLTHGIR